eukprot:2785975-Pleurochrysis_carterae.AAC.3
MRALDTLQACSGSVSRAVFQRWTRLWWVAGHHLRALHRVRPRPTSIVYPLTRCVCRCTWTCKYARASASQPARTRRFVIAGLLHAQLPERACARLFGDARGDDIAVDVQMAVRPPQRRRAHCGVREPEAAARACAALSVYLRERL